MKMKIEEMPRASEGDTIELEGKVFRLKEPNSNDFDGEIVWGQFVVLKDETGEQGCWLKLASQANDVTKGVVISIKGKLGKEYTTSRGKKARSINNCDFEVIEIVQGSAQSSKSTTEKPTTQSTQGNGRDDYWTKKFEWDKLVHFSIIRECAIKAVTELAKIPPSKTFLIKVHTEKDFFVFADKIQDYIRKKITSEDIIKEFGGTAKEEKEETKEETKEERTKKAKEIVGKTEFKPASTKQKNIIFGYTDKEGFHKGMIDSRYIETEEIKKIGDPKKLSVEEASAWIEFWWGEQGNPEDIGARKQRELDNPRNENGKPVNALVKGDKTSISKEVLVDDIYALRREHRLNDDVKFKKLMGYNPKIEELTEAELTKLKGILKRYVPIPF